MVNNPLNDDTEYNDNQNFGYEIIQENTEKINPVAEIKNKRFRRGNSESNKVENRINQFKLTLCLCLSAVLAIFSVSNSQTYGYLGQILKNILDSLFGETQLLLSIFIATGSTIIYKKNYHKQLICIMSVVLFLITSILMCKNGNNTGFIGIIFYSVCSSIIGDTALIVISVIIYTFAIFITVSEVKAVSKNFNGNMNLYELPESKLNLGLLKKFSNNKESAKINEVFRNFNIEAEVCKVTNRLSIIGYELKIGSSTKINKIINLEPELSMALETENINIATENGKLYIEVLKSDKIQINLSEVFHSEEFTNSKPLEIPIGKDMNNKTTFYDISKFPHLLVAGATGGGKSVFVNSSIIYLIKKNSPDVLKMILIDTKKVELSIYKDIPHLLKEVITKPEDAMDILNWLISEMNRRYSLMSELCVRNIDRYNEKSF